MTLNKLRLQANEKGFTLIELMIVIAIIGILAAIAIPNYISYRDKAYCSGAESDANAILGTLADYYAIPSRTNKINGTVGPTATDLQGVSFKALTAGNVATLTGGGTGAPLRVSVLDASKRCPKTYRDAQVNAGWTNTSAAQGSFNKTM